MTAVADETDGNDDEKGLFVWGVVAGMTLAPIVGYQTVTVRGWSPASGFLAVAGTVVALSIAGGCLQRLADSVDVGPDGPLPEWRVIQYVRDGPDAGAETLPGAILSMWLWWRFIVPVFIAFGGYAVFTYWGTTPFRGFLIGAITFTVAVEVASGG